MKLGDTTTSEADYLHFFRKLRLDQTYKGLTLWLLYSNLNAFHQRLYGKRMSVSHISIKTHVVFFTRITAAEVAQDQEIH